MVHTNGQPISKVTQLKYIGVRRYREQIRLRPPRLPSNNQGQKHPTGSSPAGATKMGKPTTLAPNNLQTCHILHPQQRRGVQIWGLAETEESFGVFTG